VIRKRASGSLAARECLPVYARTLSKGQRNRGEGAEKERRRRYDLEANEVVTHLVQAIQDAVWVSEDVVQDDLPEYASYDMIYNITCDTTSSTTSHVIRHDLQHHM